MILESIVTTLDQAGRVNIAPMGPIVTDPSAMRLGTDPGFLLRPFEGSRTCDNLLRTRRATIHVTDDAALFATTAVGSPEDSPSLVRSIDEPGWLALRECHRWFAVEVESVSGSSPRWEMPCRVRHSAVELPFFGFNRAKHALIEASILATRTHLLDAIEIRSQLEHLTPAVEKTAGPDERDAFERLIAEINRRLDLGSTTDRP